LKRNRVLRVLADGGSLDEAATEIGTTKMSINRYCQAHPEFRESCARAREQGDASRRTVPSAASGVEPPPPLVTERQPTLEAEAVASLLGVDPGIAMDVESIIDSDTQLDLPEGPLTLRNYLKLCWKRASSTRKDAAQWARLLAPPMLGPVLQAQERQSAVAGKQGLTAELSDGDSAKVTSRAGMTVLEVPANKARPFLNQTPEIVDAELVEN
jgi:hypothetical protein